MRIKPKEVLINLPIVLMFEREEQINEFAANINTILHGKVRVKCEELGELDKKKVGIFYLQRNLEYQDLRDQFVSMIENEEMINASSDLSREEEELLAPILKKYDEM